MRFQFPQLFWNPIHLVFTTPTPRYWYSTPASPYTAFTTCRCLVEDESGSWGEISPPRFIKVKVSLDVFTVGGSNYKERFEILVSTLFQKSEVSQVHLSDPA